MRYAERSTPGGQRTGGALTPHVDFQSGGAQGRRQLVQPLEPRLGVRRVGLRTGPHDGEQPPQLTLCLAPRGLDRAQRFARLVGPCFEEVIGRTCLHHDHRDAVRDHVVQLAGDARLLLCHGSACRLLDRLSPVARHLAQCPRHEDEGHREQGVLGRRGEEVRRREAEQRNECDAATPAAAGRPRASRARPTQRRE